MPTLMAEQKPRLYTSLSPALLHLYDLNNAIVVIIDVLRATSTIATALYNGAKCIIPVDSVSRCIELGKQMDCYTAGERDGKGKADHAAPDEQRVRDLVESYASRFYRDFHASAPAPEIGSNPNRTTG